MNLYRKSLFFVAIAASSLFEAALLAQPIGQWDFNSGNLNPTVGTTPMSYVDGPGGPTSVGTTFGSTTLLGIPSINGTAANVMKFPASSSTMGYYMPNPADPNGGGSLVNTYTIVMDVLFPSAGDGHVRPLVQTDDGVITPDADLVIDSSGGIGAPPGPFSGSIAANTWYRIGFAVTSGEIHKFINGVEVGVQATDGLDGRFALTPGGSARLFQNSTLSGAASGYVSSIQIWNTNLNAGQMAVLGAATASKIPTNITSVPSFIESRSPAVNATSVGPLPPIAVLLNPGGTTINTSTIKLALDGTALATLVTPTNGSSFLITASVTSLLAPASIHTNSLIYSDSALGLQTNSWAFTVLQYQNVSLPAPIYLETFDEVAQDGIPAGWVRTNASDTLVPGLNLSDTQSDSYKDWTTIDVATYVSVYGDTDNYNSPGFPNVSGNRRMMIPPIVENGVLLTSLASGNLIVAESDQRGGSQVQVLFTSDYNLTGHTNVYVSFHNINEQNQDNICAVEYSIDHGATWQPLLYMLDDGTTDADGSDVVTNKFTGALDVFATFNTARNDQAHGKAYGDYIGAVVSTNLAPFIRPCRNDDPVQQKRIEIFRLPLADGQPAVRLRFLQAGTGSWFFDIDNLGFYSIDYPLIVQQPSPVIADFNGPAAFTVVAGGSSLTYQWKFNGTNIPGATAATYSIANTSSNSIGLYQVAVTNGSGFALSDQVPLSLVFTPVIITAPQEQTVTLGSPVSLSVTARGGQPLSYQWLLNSNAIPGATGTNYLIASTTTNDSGFYQVQVSNSFSTVLSHAAKLTVFAGAITQDMVVHLTFDNTYADSSGHGNDSSPVNTPSFTNGFLGQAIHVNNNGTPANAPSINNYVTLGFPGDLRFGSDLDAGGATDFSVSFWTKIFEQNDDQSFIGDKDWDSGSNPGWIIDSEGDGMKWNYRDNAIANVPGVGNTRRDSPHVAPQILDGGWHHVLVTFARHSVGRIYVDGSLVNEQALGVDSPTNIVGSIDTDGIGWHVNIGQDGTGTYTDGGSVSHIDMLMDDVAIWRRVLTTNEAFGIFTAGLLSNAVDHASISFTSAPPLITVQPQDTGGGLGATVSMIVSALGSPAPVYQWWFGNTPITGETNRSYTITNMQASFQGTYKVVVTNSVGAVTSRIATVSFLGAPVVVTQPASKFVSAGATNIQFTVSASGVTPLGYQWYKNGTAISGATDTSLTFASVSTADSAGYSVTITNSIGSTNSVTAQLVVFGGSLGDNLVAYLPFDGTYKDYSIYHNDGVAHGSPSFAAGRVGQSLHFTTTNDESVLNYVSLGYPANLQFGTGSFSVGFWINYTNQGDDPPFISNKDWNSSNNHGWGVFSQSSGRFRVNATGTGGTKMDTTSTPLVRDGNWHQILCTFWRDQFVSTYVDGQLINTVPALFTGSVDTVTNGFAVNIGQDGTGHYTDNHDSSLHIDGFIDEVMLWNRVVTPTEVMLLYNSGTNGLSPLPIVTSLTRSSTSVTINWIGGLRPFTIESKAQLNGSTWTTVGTTSAHSFTGTITGSPAFVRVRGSNQ